MLSMDRSKSYSEAMNAAESLEGLVQAISTTKNEVHSAKRRLSRHQLANNEFFFRANAASEQNIKSVGLEEHIRNSDDLADAVYRDCFNYLSSETETEDESNHGLMMKLDANVETKVEINEAANSVTLEDRQIEDARRSMADAIRLGIMGVDSIEVVDSNVPSTMTTNLPTMTNTITTSSENHTHRRSKFRRTPENTGYRSKRHKRVVLKSGEENVPMRMNVEGKSRKYMKDIVTTLINSQWRWILLIFFVSHMLVWFFFAILWYVTALAHDDLTNEEHTSPCIDGTTTFVGMFLLSVETQITIGYGNVSPNENCPEAIFIMIMEVIIGTALTGALTGILFAKIIRPQKHLEGVGFSKRGVICQRDGELCFMFRVWDLKQSHIINTGFSAYLLKTIKTLEGERLQNYICKLDIPKNIFLIWPMTVIHVINEESPLFIMSPEEIMESRIEIVICLTGASSITGQTTQSRTSYLAKDILWGYRFERVLRYCNKKNCYIVDVDKLNEIESVPTPLCSAAILREVWENVQIEQDDMMPPSSSYTDSTVPTMGPYPRQRELAVAEDDPSTHSGSTVTPGWNYRRQFVL